MIALGLVVTTPVAANPVVTVPLTQGEVEFGYWWIFVTFAGVTCLPLEYLVLRALLPKIPVPRSLPIFVGVQAFSYPFMNLLSFVLGWVLWPITAEVAPSELRWLIFLLLGPHTAELFPLLFEPWALRSLAHDSEYSERRVRWSVILANLASFAAGFGAIALLGEYLEVYYLFRWPV